MLEYSAAADVADVADVAAVAATTSVDDDADDADGGDGGGLILSTCIYGIYTAVSKEPVNTLMKRCARGMVGNNIQRRR